ncbi:helix-turn-helix domain-containing protein [Cloacibacillus evryensis]|uniref:helix-turn-helix domain-containing protein n=1 Tax=Cloacibacillus evryensis TaxID=508460 RepID=UPI002B207AB0|nr:helix-turn-helix domain-containing protein [Cloacibacillus evryensis]MEA5034214.1 helix-turn-helix domain-containing protein [Cloacibacillus evryensis]
MNIDTERIELKELLTEHIRKLDELAEARPPRLVTEKEAGAYLGVSPGTLRSWREAGKGPDFLYLEGKGTIIRYDIKDLDTYADTHPRRKESKHENDTAQQDM